jgi:hypothetical protein
MALPGLLIEYLINGALALLWLYPLLRKFGLAEIHSSYLPFFALGLYVVGMIVDYIAWVVTRPVKFRIRKRIKASLGVESKSSPGLSHLRQVKFAIYAPEIAKEAAMRSSRDRIARGAIINSILAIIINLILSTNIFLTLILGMVALIVCTIMWISFETFSYSYEVKAEQAVDEKIEYEKYK